MLTHERWLGSQRFHEPALAATHAHYRAVLQGRDAQLEGIEADLAVWYDAPPSATRGPPERLSGHDPAGRVDAGQCGVRLAPVPGICIGRAVSSHDRDLVEVVSRWPRRSPAALP